MAAFKKRFQKKEVEVKSVQELEEKKSKKSRTQTSSRWKK